MTDIKTPHSEKNLKIIKKVIKKMEKINPTRNKSHEECDWVVENFIDFIKPAGFDGDIDKAAIEFLNNEY